VTEKPHKQMQTCRNDARMLVCWKITYNTEVFVRVFAKQMRDGEDLDTLQQEQAEKVLPDHWYDVSLSELEKVNDAPAWVAGVELTEIRFVLQ